MAGLMPAEVAASINDVVEPVSEGRDILLRSPIIEKLEVSDRTEAGTVGILRRIIHPVA
jgi:hypothetical protein